MNRETTAEQLQRLVPQPKAYTILEGRPTTIRRRDSDWLSVLRQLEAKPTELGIVVSPLDIETFRGRNPADVSPSIDAERRASGSPEGYILRVDGGRATIAADSDAGQAHGRRTLAQLIAVADDDQIPSVAIYDWPSLATRGFQICYHMVNDGMPMMAPSFNSATEMIRAYAGFKMNALLLEIEAIFPYHGRPELSASFCFTEEQIAQLREVCSASRVEIIPLVQTVGHAYNVLRNPEYAHLREVPETSQQYCTTNPQARSFLRDILVEVADAFPESRRIHLGGDEARRLGACPDCADKLREHGMGRLYGDHVNDVAEVLLERDITPIVWGDIADNHPDIIEVLNPSIEIAYWNYDIAGGHRPFRLEEYADHGRSVIGCSAAKFGRQSDHFLFYRKSMRNVAMMSSECIRVGAAGTIVTDWMKLAPTEVSAPAIAYGAETGWSGPRNQRDFGDAYSRLFFGVAMSDLDQLCKDLAGLANIPHEPPSGHEILPFSESNEVLADLRDRYDLVRTNWKSCVIAYEDQTTWPEVTERLTRAADILDSRTIPRLEALAGDVAHRGRFFVVILLAARTRSLNSRIGLRLIEAMRLLKFPAPEERGERSTCSAVLVDLAEEWGDLAEQTRELNRLSVFEEVVEANVRFRFDPELGDFLRVTAAKLDRDERVLSFVD